MPEPNPALDGADHVDLQDQQRAMEVDLCVRRPYAEPPCSP